MIASGLVQRLLRTLTLLSILLFMGRPAQPQDEKNVCEPLPKVSVPEQDRPTIADVENQFHSAGCFAGEIYYSDASDRFRKARFCVLAKLGLIRNTTSPAQIKLIQSAAASGATDPEDLDVMDSAVLGMLYANGEGVQRNLPLARQFVCGSSDGVGGDSPADDLGAFEQAIKKGTHYDACDVDSGRSMAYRCTGLQLQLIPEEISREENAITASLPASLEPSFRQLQAARRTFDKASAKLSNEGCENGPGCGLFVEEAELRPMSEWLSLLKAIHEDGPAPAATISASSFRTLDNQLNLEYQNALTTGDPAIRAADRAWLKYRDAWVQFGTLRWPAVTADQWRAWQTAEWLKLLAGT
jgi:hypothetical protein